MDVGIIVYLSNIIHVSFLDTKIAIASKWKKFQNVKDIDKINIFISYRPEEVECRVRNFLPNTSYKDSTAIPINKTDTGPRGKKNMNFRKKEKEILDEVLGSSRYDSRIRPAGHSNDTSKLALKHKS